MALVILAGVFIDAARILVAERKVQSSLNTAVRSVLAGYDEDLVGQFGIYGLEANSKETQLKAEVYKYFHSNLIERHKGMKLINYEVKPENISISTTGNLLTNEVYKKQILEYMKYKAPLIMTEDLISKFKNIGIKENLEFFDKEKSARNIGENIKSKLKNFNDMAKEIGKSIGLKVINELKNSLKESINNNFGASIEKLEKLKQCHLNAKNYISNLDTELTDYFKAKDEADKAAQSAKAETTINEFLNTKPDKVALETMINNNVNKIDYLINRISSEGQQIANLKKQLENLQKQTDIDSEEISTKQTEINDRIRALQTEIDETQFEDIAEISFGEEQLNIEPEHEPDKENTKGFFEELKNLISGKLLLKSIKSTGGLISDEEIKKASLADKEEYEGLSKNIEDIDNLHKEETLEKQNTNILTFMSKFQNFLSDVVVNERDNIYITEYIMDKYTFTTSQTERNHYFNKAEVEYILSGQDIEAENAALLLGDVWFLRFGIDTVDYFVTSKIPHPVARIIWAMVEGATRAFKDIYELYTTKKGCAICPSIPNVTVSYSDILRLFLLMKNEDIKLNRMRQLLQVDLMEENKEFRLENCETVVKADAEVKVNLLFIPLLQLDKLKLEHFKGGKYIIRKEIVTGY